MASMTEYYGRMKAGFGQINPQDMAQLTEDFVVAGATGVGLGLVSAALGGLDHKVFGIDIPVDGVMSVGLGIAGLQMGGPTGKALKLASIAAAGSATTRVAEKFFKAGFHMKGEFEDLGSGALGIGGHRWHGEPALGYGFGAGEHDQLVEAAKYL